VQKRNLESVSVLRRETITYACIAAGFGVPTLIVSYFLEANDSLGSCNTLWRMVGPYFNLESFFFYRLLLAKSTLYDPMTRMRKLTTVVYWLIHLVVLPVSIFSAFSAYYWSREFIEVEGQRVCVEFISGIPQILGLVLNAGISGMCIVILLGPVILSPISKSVKKVVLRNVLFMTTSILASLTLFLYVLLAPTNRQRFPKLHDMRQSMRSFFKTKYVSMQD